MKIKTSELSGAALDWAVAKVEGALRPLGNVVIEGKKLWIEIACNPLDGEDWDVEYTPSTDWAQGGPIIDREDITWSMQMLPEHGDATRFCAFSYRVGSSKAQAGPTKLIAAMRCFVASRLGDEVDVPEELCQ